MLHSGDAEPCKYRRQIVPHPVHAASATWRFQQLSRLQSRRQQRSAAFPVVLASSATRRFADLFWCAVGQHKVAPDMKRRTAASRCTPVRYIIDSITHFLYEISLGTCGTKRSNRETVTSENIPWRGFYCICLMWRGHSGDMARRGPQMVSHLNPGTLLIAMALIRLFPDSTNYSNWTLLIGFTRTTFFYVVRTFLGKKKPYFSLVYVHNYFMNKLFYEPMKPTDKYLMQCSISMCFSDIFFSECSKTLPLTRINKPTIIFVRGCSFEHSKT